MTAVVSSPIDIVYLWVDGADPLWQARRHQALTQNAEGHHASLGRYGDVQGRYRDNGELRFNLRALERFFPEHGHIYIITDGQTPQWLQAGDGLTLIDHRDLLPAAALPVFDSGHIESYLHHIPGLSERFFYLNDDVFFGAPVDVGMWFGLQGAAVFNEYATVPDYDCLQQHEDPLVNASLLSRDWLSAQDPAYQHLSQIFAHSPRPMFKSVMFALEAAAPELFHQVRSTVFRSWAVPPLIPDLVPRWMVETGLALQRQADSIYLCSGDDDADDQFQQLAASFGRLDFFCINDTSDESSADTPELQRIRISLERLLPAPSRFEMDEVCQTAIVSANN
jgi:hypothetical protein